MTEREKLFSLLFKRFHLACQRYQLLQDGDQILIGLSGGKDSLLLTEFLAKQARIFVPNIRVEAVYVRVATRGYVGDTDYLNAFCQQLNIPFRVLDTTIQGEERKDPCFLCSWQRRKALLELAQQTGCNKIALGHHRDDILETLLMNMIFQGSIAAIPPLLQLDKMPVSWIRPLCLLDEQDIARYADLSEYRPQTKLCPFEKNGSRDYVKHLLQEWRSLNPDINASLWHAIENIKQNYL